MYMNLLRKCNSAKLVKVHLPTGVCVEKRLGLPNTVPTHAYDVQTDHCKKPKPCSIVAQHLPLKEVVAIHWSLAHIGP